MLVTGGTVGTCEPLALPQITIIYGTKQLKGEKGLPRSIDIKMTAKPSYPLHVLVYKWCDMLEELEARACESLVWGTPAFQTSF